VPPDLPGTTKAPPCMRWRGLAASCCPAVADRSVSAGPAGRAPRAAFRDCSRHALVERVARCGLPVPIARVQLLRGAGAPRGLPVPIARVQLLRGARSSRSAGPDCSGPAPTESGCPADLAPIARDPPARDCLASPCLDCSRQLVARPAPTCDRAIARLSTPRNSSPSSETRCEPRSPAARRAPGVAPRAGPRSR